MSLSLVDGRFLDLLSLCSKASCSVVFAALALSVVYNLQSQRGLF